MKNVVRDRMIPDFEKLMCVRSGKFRNPPKSANFASK